MSVPEWVLRRILFILASTTLVWACVTIAHAAPASVPAKAQTSPAATNNKFSPKSLGANAGKASKGAAADAPKQGSAQSKTAEKKTGVLTKENQDTWPPSPMTHQFAPEMRLDTSGPPPSLPRASRVRMRACAEEWTRKKLLARSDLPRWRDFATSCLTGKKPDHK